LGKFSIGKKVQKSRKIKSSNVPLKPFILNFFYRWFSKVNSHSAVSLATILTKNWHVDIYHVYLFCGKSALAALQIFQYWYVSKNLYFWQQYCA